MRIRSWLLIVSSLALANLAGAQAPAKSCASLKRVTLPNVTINVAASVVAGVFVPPDQKPDEKVPPIYKKTPAFCRIEATLAPSSDSDIKVEVWMPASAWNGKFRGVGNGGFAGYIAYPALAAAVMQGYATASTDTGHATTDATWALGHPQKVVDYGYRAIHETAVDAKAIIKAFYGDAPKHSYFGSCSNGGRQALMEAQRFPDDYDGIMAGAPANAWVPMVTGGLGFIQLMHGASYIPPAKIPAISKVVNSACDAQDGVKDGVLNDPRQCHFDLAVLRCKGQPSDACLTDPQIKTLKTIYSGAHDAVGKQIFPGLLPGAEDGENGWANWVTGKEEGKSAGVFYVGGYFANMVYEKKDWDPQGVDLGSAMKLAYEKTGDQMDALNPDINAFLARGGKLILYHGWNDPGISPLNTVNYYDQVVKTVGSQKTEQSVRLYMVPGMQHCGGGPGANFFGQIESAPRSDADHDVFTSLVQWVEDGKAPGTIIASKYGDEEGKVLEMTRPLCPYPQAAEYNGTGDTKVAASFSCAKEGK